MSGQLVLNGPENSLHVGSLHRPQGTRNASGGGRGKDLKGLTQHWMLNTLILIYMTRCAHRYCSGMMVTERTKCFLSECEAFITEGIHACYRKPVKHNEEGYHRARGEN